MTGDSATLIAESTTWPRRGRAIEALIECLLIVLFVFMPLAFGAVQAWSEQIVIILSGAIAICLALKFLLSREAAILRGWTYLPIAFFILVVLLQLTPLPKGLLQLVSPNTVALKSELLGDQSASGALGDFVALSFYSYATKHQLRLLLAGVVVYVAVVNVFRKDGQIKRILTYIALIGGAVSLIALIQNAFGNGKIYGLVPIRQGQAHSGPFVNHSHFSQFVNLSVGAALAIMIVALHEHFGNRSVTTPALLSYLSSRAARILWLMVAVVIAGVSAVFISLSRGGIISMLAAAAVTTALVIRRRNLRAHTWFIGFVAVGALVCVIYTGFEAVYERLGTLWGLGGYHTRWQILKDLTAVFRLFPFFGTGLGTHSEVYPMFSHCDTAAKATHVENEYAQLMEETGLVGLVLAGVFGALILHHFVCNVRRGGKPVCSASYGIGFGLVAVLIHSLTDFGQHLPANAFLSATFCGLLVSLSNLKQRDSVVTSNSKWPSSVALRLVIFVIVCGAFGWAFRGANNFRLAEASWKKVLDIEQGLVEDHWKGTEGQYAQLIQNAQAASQFEPGNIEYCYWLSVYKWRSLSQQVDPETGGVILSDEAVAATAEIADELAKATVLCPTFGPAYCLSGQLELFVLEKPGGARKITKGFELAPCDPVACFAAGFLDVENGQFEKSLEKFKRAILLDGSVFEEVVAVYLNKTNRPDLALAVAAENVSRTKYVLNILAQSGAKDAPKVRRLARRQLVRLLETKCRQPEVSAVDCAALGQLYREQGRTDAAIRLYRRALHLNYGQVRWRLELAKALAKTGDIDSAIHEARICLRLRPDLAEAKKLIAQLSVRPVAISPAESTSRFAQW